MPDQLWATLFEHGAQAIARLGPDGRIGSINAAGKQLLGNGAGELAGRSLRELLKDDDRPRAKEQLRQALSGRPASFEAKTPDDRPLSATLLPIVRDGAVVELVATVQDAGPSALLARDLRSAEARQRLLLAHS